jgi:hypothetical protein
VFCVARIAESLTVPPMRGVLADQLAAHSFFRQFVFQLLVSACAHGFQGARIGPRPLGLLLLQVTGQGIDGAHWSNFGIVAGGLKRGGDEIGIPSRSVLVMIERGPDGVVMDSTMIVLASGFVLGVSVMVFCSSRTNTPFSCAAPNDLLIWRRHAATWCWGAIVFRLFVDCCFAVAHRQFPGS